jgi:hypothetical protein
MNTVDASTELAEAALEIQELTSNGDLGAAFIVFERATLMASNATTFADEPIAHFAEAGWGLARALGARLTTRELGSPIQAAKMVWSSVSAAYGELAHRHPTNYAYSTYASAARQFSSLVGVQHAARLSR